MVECLLNISKALGSIPGTTETNKKEQKTEAAFQGTRIQICKSRWIISTRNI